MIQPADPEPKDPAEEALARNPAGLLRLKPARIRRVDWGFDFLGYTFHRRGGEVTARPTRKKLEEKRNRFWRKRVAHRQRGWRVAHRQRGWRLAIPHVARKIRSFRTQYPLWGDAGLMWEENLLHALEELDYCPPGDARELGRLFGRALDLAGDDGLLSSSEIRYEFGDDVRLIECTVYVRRTSGIEVLTTAERGRALRH